jgi:GNAT superfamily N-acetyltransferase
MRVEALSGPALDAALEDVAQLRIAVFRDWPYLYDGDLDYERAYLKPYRQSPRAIVVAAFDGARVIGAATGAPMAEHAEDFASALAGSGLDLARTFYCAESVLLAPFRGTGIGHRFFDLREAHARALGFSHMAFCSVIRPADHPLRPKAYRPLDSFWQKRGYAPLPGAVARFEWKDINESSASHKPLQFWSRAL